MEVGGESGGVRIDMELKKKERVWKTRVNCLEAHTKQFTSILQLLQSLRVRIPDSSTRSRSSMTLSLKA